ncbi:hypothetical protein EDD17DRAFT_1870696 [Pisolithus thermaeus]|nr:hypothetical protein EDD17DRAFT_1870696 [Pisolithus thermaeus]
MPRVHSLLPLTLADNSAAKNKQGQTRGSHPLVERIRFGPTIQQPASLVSTSSSCHSLRRIRYRGHSFITRLAGL